MGRPTMSRLCRPKRKQIQSKRLRSKRFSSELHTNALTRLVVNVAKERPATPRSGAVAKNVHHLNRRGRRPSPQECQLRRQARDSSTRIGDKDRHRRTRERGKTSRTTETTGASTSATTAPTREIARKIRRSLRKFGNRGRRTSRGDGGRHRSSSDGTRRHTNSTTDHSSSGCVKRGICRSPALFVTPSTPHRRLLCRSNYCCLYPMCFGRLHASRTVGALPSIGSCVTPRSRSGKRVATH
jgi:hypothetical protein